MSKNIAVIGAGIAGLTAAYYLQKFGYTVTVYEASNRVGGRMITDKINGCLIDAGAQFLSSEYTTLIRLIHELNMSSELDEASTWMGIVRNNNIKKISTNHSGNILMMNMQINLFLKNLAKLSSNFGLT